MLCCLFVRLKLVGSCCYRGSRKDRYIVESHRNLRKEFEISNLFKKLNVFEGVLKELVADPAQWRSHVAKYRLFTQKELVTMQRSEN